MKHQKHRVAVAMSGGVDSSVAAALLLKQGYDVMGIFAKTWTPRVGDGTTCTSVADRRDALRVAAQLGIPLETIDLEEAYRAGVVEPLFTSYARGETPNPDVLCNKIVKFGALWSVAQNLGATHLATGHYARVATRAANGEWRMANGLPNKNSDSLLATRYSLFRGVDSHKDQSYFLWDIPPAVLPAVLFPIGKYTKPEVRKLAAKFDLPVADKKDSQGICFLGQTNLATFLGQRIPASSGPIRDWQSGITVGTHQGIHLFTIGQRHGLGQMTHETSAKPVYVLGIEAESQTVWVGPESRLLTRQLTAYQFSWLIKKPETILSTLPHVTAQIRYRQVAEGCQFRFLTSERAAVEFNQSVRAATPGQSIVFYEGSRVLGGGVIESFELSKK
jgi:tRNA-specific 2-thiouridylase